MPANELYPYSLLELLVASYAPNADTYGSPYSLEADHLFEITPQADTDMMRDSGTVSRGLTVVTHAQVKVGRGGLTFPPLGIMIGADYTDYYMYPHVGGSGLPYFGAMGVVAADTDEVVVCGVRAIKLDTEPMYQMDGKTNKYMIQETQGKAFARMTGSVPRVHMFKRYATMAAWAAVKPANGTAFKSWFTGV